MSDFGDFDLELEGEQESGDGFEGMTEGATIGADPPEPDPFDREARQARMVAHLEGRGAEHDADALVDAYDQSGEDLAAIEAQIRGAQAAEYEAYNADVDRAAREHGVELSPEDRKDLWFGLQGTDQFGGEGVRSLIERVSHEEEIELKEIMKTGRDPETGRFLDYRDVEKAKEEWRRRFFARAEYEDEQARRRR